MPSLTLSAPGSVAHSRFFRLVLLMAAVALLQASQARGTTLTLRAGHLVAALQANFDGTPHPTQATAGDCGRLACDSARQVDLRLEPGAPSSAELTGVALEATDEMPLDCTGPLPCALRVPTADPASLRTGLTIAPVDRSQLRDPR